MRRATIAVLLLAALAGTAVAGPFEDAVSAHKRGDYATTLREFRVLAAQGHAEAQNNLGLMYAKGEGVSQDYAAAVRQDYVQAVKWFTNAAEQSLAAAQFNLGVMYRKGEGVPRDYTQAHMWFSLAGAQGDKQAAKQRDIVAKRMTVAQIAQAAKMPKPNTIRNIMS